MKKIVLVGTGNIGKRFLQAIHAVESNVPILCYDNQRTALESVKPFLESYGLSDRSEKTTAYEEAIDEIDEDTLVIVATTAEDRINLLLDIVDEEPKYLISEKPVTQTEIQYSKIARACRDRGVSAYVHYYLRFQPFIEEIKRRVDLSTPFHLGVRLPGNGMACNGIHFLDLFLWLSGMRQFVVQSMRFDDIYEQKRSGFWDVYGEINVATERGDTCTISNAKTNRHQVITLDTEGAVINVYEERKKVSIVTEENAEFYDLESLYASEYLVNVIGNYVNGNWKSGAGLTPLSEAVHSHRILFEFLRFSNCPGLNIT
jgi:predicted dehydrogenase